MSEMKGWSHSLECPVNNVKVMHVVQSPSDANQLIVIKERHRSTGDLGKMETYQFQSVCRGVDL